MRGALRVDEAHIPEFVLLVELEFDFLEALLLLHGRELGQQIFEFFGRRARFALKIAALGKDLQLGQQLGNLLVANALVDLIEKRKVFVQRGHEAGELGAFQAGRAFSVSHQHAIGGALHHHLDELGVVLDVLLEFALLDAIERRLRDVYVPLLDQLFHVAEEKCEQKGADVRSVDVGIGHQDDLAVTQLGDVEIIFADAGAERGDHGADFLVSEHLVVARLLDVQDFSLQRQDGLKAAVASLLGGAAGAFSLDQVNFTTLRLAFGTVGQLARQTSAVERALAAGEIAGLARRFTRPRRLDRLVDDLAGNLRVLLEEGAEAFVEKRLHGTRDVGVELALGLPFELRLRQLDRDHRHQAFAHVIAGEVFLHVLEQRQLLTGVVDGARQRGAEAGQMRSAIDGVDVVGEAEDGVRVTVVVLERDLHGDAVALGFHVNRLLVQYVLAAVQMLDELGDAAAVLELGALGFAGFRIGRALVGEGDEQSLVQEGELTQALRQRVLVVLGGGENLVVGNKRNRGAAALGGTGFFELAGWLALRVRLLPGKTIAPDFQIQPMGKRVHATDANPVQTAGNLIAVAIEFAARVQHGHHHLRGRQTLAIDFHLVDGDAAAIVDNGDGVVVVDGDLDLVGIAGQGFVDRVVHHFVHQVMKPQLAGRTNVHGGPLADRFHAAEYLDGVRVILAIAVRLRGILIFHFGVHVPALFFCFSCD